MYRHWGHTWRYHAGPVEEQLEGAALCSSPCHVGIARLAPSLHFTLRIGTSVPPVHLCSGDHLWLTLGTGQGMAGHPPWPDVQASCSPAPHVPLIWPASSCGGLRVRASLTLQHGAWYSCPTCRPVAQGWGCWVGPPKPASRVPRHPACLVSFTD